MFHMPESRFAAFGAHLIVSLALFSGLALFTYFMLLPGFLFYSDGGSTILGLIGGIDVVLGPLITLVIYKKTKPGIKMDLSIIALIQVSALIYGLYSLWSVRPLAVFYAQGEYHVTYQSTFAEPTFSDISDNKALHNIKTPTYGIDLPEQGPSLSELSFMHVLKTGKSYFSREDLYLPYEEMIPSLKDDAISPSEAVKRLIIKQNSAASKLNPEHFGIFKYVSSASSGYMVLDLRNGKFVQTI